MPRRKASPFERPEAIPSVWGQSARRLKGTPLTFFSRKDPFAQRPFLVRPLNDMHPEVYVKKARQVGATELYACTQALWVVSTLPGVWVIYTLPREEQTGEVSALRVDPAIDDSAYLSARCVSKNVGRKVFRPSYATHATLQSYMIFKSSWEQAIGEGTPADFVYFDEYDRMKEGVEEAFQETITSSKLGLKRFLSTPSLPGRGIAGKYDRSDKHSWLWKCNGCNEWQKLDWDINVKQTKGPPDLLQQIRFRPDMEVEPDTFILVCRKCGKKIDRMNAKSEWVPEFPGKTTRGYHISQLDAAWISMDAIAKKLGKTRSIQSWRNYCLGLEWAGEGKLIEEEDVLRCVSTKFEASPPGRPADCSYISIGVDWGDMNWAVVRGLPAENLRGGKPRILDVAWWSSQGEGAEAAVRGLDALVQRYKPDLIVADAGYGQDRNPKCKDRYKDKFWACMYPGTKLTTYEPEWDVHRPIRQVKVGRSPALKRLCENYRMGLYEVAAMHPDKLNVFAKHFDNLARVTEEDDMTGDVTEEIVRTGPDHLAHADQYADLGSQRGRGSVATLVTTVDESGKKTPAAAEPAKDQPHVTQSGHLGALLPPGAIGNPWIQ